MRILLHICLIALCTTIVAQPAHIEEIKIYITTKQYEKARHLLEKHLEESTDEAFRTALWYYKGRLDTDEYFDEDLTKASDDLFRKKSYLLLEGIAAFQNTVKRQNEEYTESALRQLGGLHRYLKDIAFSNLHKKQYERFYLNLDWARNCDRFVAQYISPTADSAMDTMLIYFVASTSELTGRNYKVKTCYDTFLLPGIVEQQLLTHKSALFMALGEMSKHNTIMVNVLFK